MDAVVYHTRTSCFYEHAALYMKECSTVYLHAATPSLYVYVYGHLVYILYVCTRDAHQCIYSFSACVLYRCFTHEMC